MSELPIAPVSRILKKTGAERISTEAEYELVSAAEKYIEQVSRRAIRIARHTGRKTVQAKDIKLATEE